MSGRYVPVDAAAEASVLGGLLTSPDAYLDVADLLGAADFGAPGHADIYQAIRACDEAGRPVDQVTVAHELRRMKRLGPAGGVERLAALVETASEGANVVAHARIVAEKALLRRIADAGRLMVSDGLSPDADGPAALERAEQSVFALAREGRASTLTPLAEAVPSALRELAETRGRALLGVPSGLTRLDRMTSGFRGGQLIVLAARPGVGKSALALQMAHHIAATTGDAVIFNSLEMSTSELTFRLLANTLGYDSQRLAQGDVPDALSRDLAVAAAKLAEVPLLLDDSPPPSITGLRSAMRRAARRRPLAAIVVDYLQLMQGDLRWRDGNRTQEVSEISRGLKLLASELDVPIIALSQLNRALENRPNRRPQLSDLRESGAIEQDANAVLFLYRDNQDARGEGAGTGELIVAKQRSGPTGVVHLRLDMASSRITDVDAPAGWYDGGAPTRGGTPF